MADDVFVHPSALNECESVGAGTRIWAFAHVMRGAVVGSDCNIGDHSFIEGGAVVGSGATIKNGVCLWEGVTLEDFVFVGPNAVFTNDRYPRSPRAPVARERYAGRDWLVRTVVREGASIGANATVVAGVVIGRYACVAAGSVVTRPVGDFRLAAGCPARPVGIVCMCGARLPPGPGMVCSSCNRAYREDDGKISVAEPGPAPRCES
ncbi:acyltransferase [Verrucomicrobiota bacterium]